MNQAPLALQRLQAVVGPSVRLRDELVADLKSAWTGPIQRLVEPDDLQRLLLDLDTPSLLGDSSLLLVRADQPWLKRHADALLAHAGQPLTATALLLVSPDLDQRSALAKALLKAKALHLAEAPDGKGIGEWLAGRLATHPQGTERPREIVAVLLDHLGADADGLLGAIEILAIHAGDGPLTPKGAAALLSGTAERPVWDLLSALFEGRAKQAIELFHAGGGAEPELVIASLLGDLRRQIACCETTDDAEAAAWVGGKGSLYYARKRAREVGRPALLGLFIGALQCQRQLRTSGVDGQLAIELFVLHAQRLVKHG